MSEKATVKTDLRDSEKMDSVEENKFNETIDNLQGTPFSESLPLARWQGVNSSILQLPWKQSTIWIYFLFDCPDDFQVLSVQTQNRSETIFFNAETKKYMRIADDNLYWSYYINGPYQRFNSGAWVPVTTNQEKGDSQVIKITGKDGFIYELDNDTGLIKKTDEKVIKESKNTQKRAEKVAKETESNSNKTRGTDPKILKENEDVWEEVAPLLEKLKKNKDLKVLQEAIKKGDEIQISEIKSNDIMNLLEEILSIYDLDFEINRELISNTVSPSIFPLDNMNEVKFVAAIILPELCIYPKSLIKDLNIKSISFCGEIQRMDTQFLSYDFGPKIYLNCKLRNIIKIQSGIHLAILSSINRIYHGELLGFENSWGFLNPPDLTYDPKRQKMPKGIKGFINLNATKHLTKDIQEIYFALLKDPPTILNYHSDIIIIKKAHLLKNTLEQLFPNVITEKWWARVAEYKDILEVALGSTDYFNEEQSD